MKSPCTAMELSLIRALPERWPSGRRRSPAKGVDGEPSRGFESLPLRHFPRVHSGRFRFEPEARTCTHPGIVGSAKRSGRRIDRRSIHKPESRPANTRFTARSMRSRAGSCVDSHLNSARFINGCKGFGPLRERNRVFCATADPQPPLQAPQKPKTPLLRVTRSVSSISEEGRIGVYLLFSWGWDRERCLAANAQTV